MAGKKNAQGGHGLIDEAEVVQSFCLLGHSATSISSTPSGPCTLRWRAQGLLYVFDSVAIPLPISVVLMRVIDSLYPNRRPASKTLVCTPDLAQWLALLAQLGL